MEDRGRKKGSMTRYSDEHKSALLKKLLPPINMSVAELARQEGVSKTVLYSWLKQANVIVSPLLEHDKQLGAVVLNGLLSVQCPPP